MSSLESILDKHLSSPASAVEQALFRELKRLDSGPHLQHVSYLPSHSFQLLQFLKKEGVKVLVETKDLYEALWWKPGVEQSSIFLDPFSEDEDEDVIPDVANEKKGALSRTVETGVLHFTYKGTKFKVYQVSWSKGHMSFVFYDFVFEHNYEPKDVPASDADLLYSYTPNSTRHTATAHMCTPAHRLITAVHTWSSSLKDEIWVFQNGGWHKDKSLYTTISTASWSDLTLTPDFLDGLRRDTRTFFANREIYKELGVTWKRGILMLGPPGNGKTESIKVLLKESGQTSLYVRSFTTTFVRLPCTCSINYRTYVDVYRGPKAVSGQFSTMREHTLHASSYLRILTRWSLPTSDPSSSMSWMDWYARAFKYFLLNLTFCQTQNEGILTIATTNHPERIDDAILNRPSRFDVKYAFELPNENLRKEYIARWMAKIKHVGKDADRKSTTKAVINVEFDNEIKTMDEVAKKTDGWSFAFLKEL
jgi:hypothetical protein